MYAMLSATSTVGSTLLLPGGGAIGHASHCVATLAFIDGLHTREGAADDIAAWWPKLKPNGGLMVLNDYGTRIFPGVKTAAHAFFGPRGLAVKVGRRGKPPGHRNAYVVRRE